MSVAVDGLLKVTSLKTGKEVQEPIKLAGSGYGVAFEPGADTVVVNWGPNYSPVGVPDLNRPKAGLSRIDIKKRTILMDITPDLDSFTVMMMARNARRCVINMPGNREVLVFDLSSDQVIHRYQAERVAPEFRTHVLKAVVSQDGTRMATTNDDNTIRIWDNTATPVKQLQSWKAGEQIHALGFLADSKELIQAKYSLEID